MLNQSNQWDLNSKSAFWTLLVQVKISVAFRQKI